MTETPTIPGYTIQEKVGAGGMGVVYRAVQTALDREVALKVIHPKLSARPEVGTRFQQEARHVAKLNHPHIVLGIDTGVADGHHYFVMEFLHGGTLLEGLKKNGPLEEKTALTYLEQMAAALHHAAGQQLLHRDIKPDNMMLGEYGKLKLMDLGLAMITSDEADDSRKIVRGTPHYISPEQLKRVHPLDARCDLYALGATFYHLLSGSPPFQGENGKAIALARLKQPVPDIRSVRPEVTEGTATLLLDMMARNREERPATPEALRERCQALLDPKPGGARASLRKFLGKKPNAKGQSRRNRRASKSKGILQKISGRFSRLIGRS
ncbi:MAG: serine/threonine-protein kinase [Planctomycetota bacterium]|jgi:serine/threonine protein kinase